MGSAGEKTGSGYIPLGKITKPHGIRGELKVLPYTETPENLKRYTTFFLSRDDDAGRIAFVRENIRLQAKSAIVKLQGCDDRNSAEKLVGCQILVEETELPEVGEGEFYLYQLEGKKAVDTEGNLIGTISTVLIGQGQNFLQIYRDNSEILVPLVSEFIVKREKEQIILDLPHGLLELYQ